MKKDLRYQVNPCPSSGGSKIIYCASYQGWKYETDMCPVCFTDGKMQRDRGTSYCTTNICKIKCELNVLRTEE